MIEMVVLCPATGGFHKYVYSNGVVLCKHCGAIANDTRETVVTHDCQDQHSKNALVIFI